MWRSCRRSSSRRCRHSDVSTDWSTMRRRFSRRRWARSRSRDGAMIGTNVQAPLFLSQAAAPALRKAQGAIVNITDIHAERPLKNYVVYSIAKAALVGLTRSLARELAPEVRVNAVAPGPILWPDDEAFNEVSRQRIISHTPLRREGRPDDIAKAVYFLLAEATYVTGETINVDGGRHIAL